MTHDYHALGVLNQKVRSFDLEGLQILPENSKYSVPNLCEIDAKLTVQQ